MRLNELLQQPKSLPTVPQVVHELIESFASEDVSIRKIVASINSDPVLSARLLRLANSAYYHVSRSIGTVDDAVVMLGFMTVRTLVIGMGVTTAFSGHPGVDLARFWTHSTRTAAIAGWLARHAQCSRDHAFTAGLMHGLGQLVMHAGMPEPMLYLDKTCDPLDARRADLERTSFGYDHAEVGAELLRLWKLPSVLVDAVGGHVSPLQAARFEPLAGVLHLAVWRARAHLFSLNADELRQTLPEAVCAKLDLSAAAVLDEMPPVEDLAQGLDAIAG